MQLYRLTSSAQLVEVLNLFRKIFNKPRARLRLVDIADIEDHFYISGRTGRRFRNLLFIAPVRHAIGKNINREFLKHMAHVIDFARLADDHLVYPADMFKKFFALVLTISLSPSFLASLNKCTCPMWMGSNPPDTATTTDFFIILV